MGDRVYTKEHCTVFSYDGDTSILAQLGNGTITGEVEELTNRALLDTATDFEFGATTWRIEAGLACENGETTDWFTKLAGSGPLIITTASRTLSGTFGVLKTEKAHADAVTWSVSLKSKGTVAIS